MDFWRHLKTVQRHRHLVRQYCFRLGLYWQGLTHDLSKFSPVEFWAGVKYFQGDRSPNDAQRRDKGYSASWMHHKGRNRHHFEYWIDYCRGEDGTPFIGGCKMPVKYVAEMSGMPLPEHEPRQSSGVRQAGGQSFEDVEILPLQNRALLHYLQERGIPSAIAVANCKEIRYTMHGKRYFAVAFGNGSGGYEIRNPFFKGCVPPKDVRVLPPVCAG